jgi:hypothetical protein
LSEILDAALAVAASGFPVFPLGNNKKPIKHSRGFNDATLSPERIQRLFERRRSGLIGVATGERSGFDVLDIDSTRHPEAGDWLRHWEPISTRRHNTRSGGSHLLFRHESGLKNQESYPVAGVDIRADGGYVCWWPAAGYEIDDHSILSWPPALLAAVWRPAPASVLISVQPQVAGIAYAAGAIACACRAILHAPNGRQYYTLNREAFSLGTLVGAGRAQEDIVRQALCSTARKMLSYDPLNPWREDHIDKIVNDAVTAGMQRPRGKVRYDRRD